MGTDRTGLILNVFMLATTVVIGLTMLHFGANIAGFFMIIIALVWTKLTVDEYQEATDPLSAYAPGGAKFKATPWNTERVADPSQPKPWWVEEEA